jgi:hypothetical protein
LPGALTIFFAAILLILWREYRHFEMRFDLFRFIYGEDNPYQYFIRRSISYANPLVFLLSAALLYLVFVREVEYRTWSMLRILPLPSRKLVLVKLATAATLLLLAIALAFAIIFFFIHLARRSYAPLFAGFSMPDMPAIIALHVLASLKLLSFHAWVSLLFRRKLILLLLVGLLLTTFNLSNFSPYALSLLPDLSLALVVAVNLVYIVGAFFLVERKLERI